MTRLSWNIRWMLIVALGLLGTILLSACVGKSPTAVVSPTEVGQPALPTPSPAYPVPAAGYPASQGGEGYPAATTPLVAYPAPPLSEPTEAPPVRTELTASDPATVKMASGQVQLIEFFAFW